MHGKAGNRIKQEDNVALVNYQTVGMGNPITSQFKTLEKTSSKSTQNIDHYYWKRIGPKTKKLIIEFNLHPVHILKLIDVIEIDQIHAQNITQRDTQLVRIVHPAQRLLCIFRFPTILTDIGNALYSYISNPGARPSATKGSCGDLMVHNLDF